MPGSCRPSLTSILTTWIRRGAPAKEIDFTDLPGFYLLALGREIIFGTSLILVRWDFEDSDDEETRDWDERTCWNQQSNTHKLQIFRWFNMNI